MQFIWRWNWKHADKQIQILFDKQHLTYLKHILQGIISHNKYRNLWSENYLKPGTLTGPVMSEPFCSIKLRARAGLRFVIFFLWLRWSSGSRVSQVWTYIALNVLTDNAIVVWVTISVVMVVFTFHFHWKEILKWRRCDFFPSGVSTNQACSFTSGDFDSEARSSQQHHSTSVIMVWVVTTFPFRKKK